MRILIGEDDVALASFVKKGMEAEHYAVDVSGDGEQVRAMGAEIDYDLVVLDLGLPRLDGVSILRALRTRKPSLPILVLTGRTRVEDRVQCLDLGADDYLGKPFSFTELSARVRALLRRCHLPAESVLAVDDLRLDRVERRVERAGRRIELTSKEFCLLEYLMRNAGRRITRAMIVEHVWNLSFDTCTNIVDVYVNYTRRQRHPLGRQRNEVAAELQGIQDQLISLANTSYQGQYLFSGTARTEPFIRDATAASGARYVGNAGVNSLMIGNGYQIACNVPGSQVFSGTGADVFAAINGLVTALQTNSGIDSATGAVRSAFDSVNAQRVFYGNAMNQIESQQTHTKDAQLQLQDQQKHSCRCRYNCGSESTGECRKCIKCNARRGRKNVTAFSLRFPQVKLAPLIPFT